MTPAQILVDKTFLDVLVSTMAAGLILVCSFLAWEAMSHKTRHCFRVVFGALGLGAAAILLLPLYPEYEWLRWWIDRGLLLAFAFYLLLDRRRVDRLRARA